MAEGFRNKLDQVLDANLSLKGGPGIKDAASNETITGTGAWTGHCYAIEFITNCTPTVLTDERGTGTASGIVYSAGTVIYGSFTAITLGASGESARLYKER